MGFGSGTMRHVTVSMMLGFMLAAAGCQSSDLNPNKGPGQGTGGKAIAAAPSGIAKISAAELRAYCPKVTLREGTAYFSTYAKAAKKPARKTDDLADPADTGPSPDDIVYQASIADVTRSCTYAPGQMTINVAVAGKVIPGPKGAAGTITMPIRVVVMQAETVLYSKLHEYQVTIPDAASPVQFVFNDPDVALPQPTTPNYRVFAGFDEGSDKDAKAKAKKAASAQ